MYIYGTLTGNIKQHLAFYFRSLWCQINFKSTHLGYIKSLYANICRPEPGHIKMLINSTLFFILFFILRAIAYQKLTLACIP